MYKEVAAAPAWLGVSTMADVYSLSNCISPHFIDYINYWRHNGYWLFDSPEIMEKLAKEAHADLANVTLFYYEMYEYEFDDSIEDWVVVTSDPSFVTNVREPVAKCLQGFDVVSFSLHASPECSPLSCNEIAKEILVNQHCLLNTFEEAKRYIEQGAFKKSEPGPYRIIAIYT